MNTLFEGEYIDIVEVDGGIELRLVDNPEARQKIFDLLRKDGQLWYDAQFITYLLDDLTDRSNWGWLRPEDIGALTSCELILTDDLTVEDDGTMTVSGNVWWHERYAIEDAFERLFVYGKVFFMKANEEA